MGWHVREFKSRQASRKGRMHGHPCAERVVAQAAAGHAGQPALAANKNVHACRHNKARRATGLEADARAKEGQESAQRIAGAAAEADAQNRARPPPSTAAATWHLASTTVPDRTLGHTHERPESLLPGQERRARHMPQQAAVNGGKDLFDHSALQKCQSRLAGVRFVRTCICWPAFPHNTQPVPT